MVIAALLNTSVKLGKRWLWDTQARMLIGIAIGVVLGWLSVRGMEWGLVADQSPFPSGMGSCFPRSS